MPTRNSADTGTEVLERIDAESTVVTALRDVLKLGRQEQVSYPEAMAEGAGLFPDLLSRKTSILHRAFEKPAIRAFREKAIAASTKERKNIEPADIVQREIKELEALIKVSTGSTKDMKRELTQLQKHLRYFTATAQSEHAIVYADVYQRNRPTLPGPSVSFSSGREYSLGKGRHLRVRMLHPDKAEHITGADVVYEVSDHQIRFARVAFAQYKMWDKERIAWSQIKSAQLRRMEDQLCKRDRCKDTSHPRERYRMPCCSAFLRLTQKLQDPESRLISAGRFIPICQLPDERKGSLELPEIASRSVTSDLFEAAFGEGLVGSDWLPFDEIEALYRKTKIFTAHDRLIIYAQEFEA
jgi:hypothetical protein